MNTSDQIKKHIAGLPHDEQDAIAQLVLLQIANRDRLERLAEGSFWIKFGWILPVVGSVALLWFRSSITDHLPLIFVIFLFLIEGIFLYTHSRIEALRKLAKADYDAIVARIDSAEQGVGGQPPVSSSISASSPSNGGGATT